MCVSLHLDLAGYLLDFDDDELRWLERGKPDNNVDNATVDVVLRGGLLVTFDEVGLARRASLECPLPEQIVHERADVEADRRPQRLVVRLEDDPFQRLK